mmetsp:Transcript_20865/g.25264  ORF Transcript_20865/g.25264 Transcript_20865/m.25264 type:complete len:411 (-) Transcript_20865:977-2209(-)|eukprot:CAMPEP_0204830060 /NCGR_PEP_ID=MMETSP1346-20131115/8308_1 /ASSEMBLY_ACC=CAM_ASM_000771 /TAXON_ID=215587 /ORGANISM="Aplanochytrium stocchinoi, Strain GSBS06" /LENGTH=410 /DNA_ID=CAMNT_0051960183 /DNA_START=102 /DNA_END=1334 /DNA_ORIENTATION=-
MHLENGIDLTRTSISEDELEEATVSSYEDIQRSSVLEERAKIAIMQAAAASAITGVNLQHGGPFGAAVVRNGKFVSLAHNTVLVDKDPTCHAEMNAIRYAAAAMGTHDLSDCELYTTCEPCPMCWGAIHWSRVRKVYTGVDRFTAAEFGFDDKVFYDELTAQSGHYAVKLGQNMPNIAPAMLDVWSGIELETVENLLGDVTINKTFRRRVGEKSIGFHSKGDRFGEDKVTSSSFPDQGILESHHAELSKKHKKYMKVLENEIRGAVRCGKNKEREVFASLIVKDGEILAISVNEVLSRRDPTSTSEILAIRKASRRLGDYNLHGCIMYSTMEPDVMSLGAILWSRIGKLYYGMSQNAAARYGFEEGLLQYRELFAEPRSVEKVLCVESKVGFEICENVFKEWKECNAVVY